MSVYQCGIDFFGKQALPAYIRKRPILNYVTRSLDEHNLESTFRSKRAMSRTQLITNHFGLDTRKRTSAGANPEWQFKNSHGQPPALAHSNY
jgi:hypothetical protein